MGLLRRRLPHRLVARVRTLSAFVALGCVVACGSAPPPPPSPPTLVEEPARPPETSTAARAFEPLSEGALRAHVDVLTQPAWAGRFAGSDGERAAADYIARTLDEVGVSGLDGQRFQTFDATGGWQAPASPTSRNVVGTLTPSSSEPEDEQWVVVGAHYDHLGEDEQGTYFGADDNASGTALLLEIGRALSARRAQLRRPVLLIFFGAEEIGLLGARAAIGRPAPRGQIHAKPLVRPEDVAVMVNLDMVGRTLLDHGLAALPLRTLGIDVEQTLGCIGISHRPALRALVEEVFAQHDLSVVAKSDLPAVVQPFVEAISNGRGDSFPFERAGVPALFFSSSTHPDYHQTTDTADLLRYDLMTTRAAALADLVVRLSNAPASSLPRSTGSPFDESAP